MEVLACLRTRKRVDRETCSAVTLKAEAWMMWHWKGPRHRLVSALIWLEAVTGISTFVSAPPLLVGQTPVAYPKCQLSLASTLCPSGYLWEFRREQHHMGYSCERYMA